MFQQAKMEAAQKMIKRKTRNTITIADMQAALWFSEKELFKMLGNSSKASVPADYEDAAKEVVKDYVKTKPKARFSREAVGTGSLNGGVVRTNNTGSCRTNEQGLPIREDGKIPFVHWSKQEGLTELNPEKHGTGISGAESNRKSQDPANWVDRTYYAITKMVKVSTINFLEECRSLKIY
jgi:hypothetical protein